MLKDIIRQKSLNQTIIAKKMGVSQQLVSSWCSGRCEPRIYQLKLLSELLKVDLPTLINCFIKGGGEN